MRACWLTANAMESTTYKELDILKASAAIGILGLVLSTPWAQAQQFYSCTDGNGRKLTSDRPIAECLDREQRVIDSTGTVRRVVGPTLTDNERAAQEAERQEELKKKAKLTEARRRARALLARYPNEVRHKEGRREALAEMNEDIAIANKRLFTLRGDRKTIDAELGPWKENPDKAPVNLQRKSADNQLLIDDQLRLIALREKEKARINEQFDNELVHLRELWNEVATRQKKIVEAPPAATPSTAP